VSANHFFARKLHSLLGVIPVGMFLIFHLIANYTAGRGAEAYNQMVQFIEGIPFVIFLEFSLIYIPILFHAIYGLYIAFQAKNNVYNISF
jgi:succinate dehydrogenase / fumarate reductase cytochrome b subunit